MLAVLSWWVVIEILGLAALPLALRWLRWLPDRGYFFAKPLGLLLTGYLLWLAATFGILDNTAVAIAVVAAALGAMCWALWSREALDYWRSRRGYVIGSEILFTLAFAVWVTVRAYNPEIAATEKPMEIAFLSAVLRSSHFPPVDPWLSGYGISYYYFGYLMIAVLAKLAGVGATVAFNLGIAILFALTIGGTFSLGYNLAAAFGRRPAPCAEPADTDVRPYPEGSQPAVGPHSAASGADRDFRPYGGGSRLSPVVCGLLTSFLVVISANLEGAVELLNARGLLSLRIWQWLAIKDLPPPTALASWLPRDDWWWFRAARVIMDVDPVTKGTRDYTINEFPFFSFLLGDLHPHLLALPFAVLGVAIALNVLLGERDWSAAALRRLWPHWLLFGIVFGGLGFTNSWDMPTYLVLLVAAVAIHRYLRKRQLDLALVRDAVSFGIAILLSAVALYFPFYIGFRSQAAGIGYVELRSQPQHFALFWGPLLFLTVGWIVMGVLAGRSRGRGKREEARSRGVGSEDPTLLSRQGDTGDRDGVGWSSALVGFGLIALVLVLVLALLVRGASVTTFLVVVLVLAGIAVRHVLHRYNNEVDRRMIFVWLLVLLGLLLIAVCEWLFIRDYFNNRMNTVFKLYYQAWLLLAVGGGYVLYWFAHRPKGSTSANRRTVWLAPAAIVLVASMAYPVAATIAKTNGFAGPATLDGMAFMARAAPDDYDAIRWLQANVSGTPVILEARGSSYSAAGRVSAFTGLPTLLGWDFHEQQWRGSYEEQRKRKADIDTLYATTNRATAEQLLRQYGVAYVYVGSLERQTYGQSGPAALDKFAAFSDIAYRNRSVTIYRLRA